MNAPKEITGSLFFSDEEPRIIGHMIIGGAHYELVGIRRSDVRTDLTGHKVNGGKDEPCRESP
jgi:hypothetical protein